MTQRHKREGTLKVGVVIFLVLVAASGVVLLPTSRFVLGLVNVQQQSKSLSFQEDVSTHPLITRCDNILLMGQFNFDSPIETIQAWVETWSKYFVHVVVVGPFPPDRQAELQNAGISNRPGRDDKGWVSPVENLMNVLLEFEHHVKIQAVLYLHDDALLNMTRLRRGQLCVPTHSIMATIGAPETMRKEGYYISMEYQDSQSLPPPEDVLVQYQTLDSHLKNESKVTSRASDLIGKLSSWERRKDCLTGQVRMLRQSFNRTAPPSQVVRHGFAEHREMLPNRVVRQRYFFVGKGQSDMALIPTQYAQLFAQAARPHLAQDVFLECALPTILHWMEHVNSSLSTPVPVDRASLCTSWNYARRGTPGMIHACQKNKKENPNGFDMYHPFKIGINGAKRYQSWLEIVQRPLTAPGKRSPT